MDIFQPFPNIFYISMTTNCLIKKTIDKEYKYRLKHPSAGWETTYIETNTPLTFDLCHELTCDLNKMKGFRVGQRKEERWEGSRKEGGEEEIYQMWQNWWCAARHKGEENRIWKSIRQPDDTTSWTHFPLKHTQLHQSSLSISKS